MGTVKISFTFPFEVEIRTLAALRAVVNIVMGPWMMGRGKCFLEVRKIYFGFTCHQLDRCTSWERLFLSKTTTLDW
jgi:hypothetical protein